MIQPQLRLTKVIRELDKGQYLTEDVLTKEEIVVKLSGKQRMHFRLPIEAVIYAETVDDKGRFIPTWRDPFRMDNTPTHAEQQRQALDDEYIKVYGMDAFDMIYVHGEFKKFKF